MSFDQTLQVLLEAIKHRDMTRLVSTISIDEDVRWVLPNGVSIKGRSAFIKMHTAWFADPDWKADFTILRTLETTEMAFALMVVDYSDATLEAQPYAKQHHLSLVFSKRDGEWFIVHDQSTIAQGAVS